MGHAEDEANIKSQIIAEAGRVWDAIYAFHYSPTLRGGEVVWVGDSEVARNTADDAYENHIKEGYAAAGYRLGC